MGEFDEEASYGLLDNGCDAEKPEPNGIELIASALSAA